MTTPGSWGTGSNYFNLSNAPDVMEFPDGTTNNRAMRSADPLQGNFELVWSPSNGNGLLGIFEASALANFTADGNWEYGGVTWGKTTASWWIRTDVGSTRVLENGSNSTLFGPFATDSNAEYKLARDGNVITFYVDGSFVWEYAQRTADDVYVIVGSAGGGDNVWRNVRWTSEEERR